jgi:hypothetical protein
MKTVLSLLTLAVALRSLFRLSPKPTAAKTRRGNLATTLTAIGMPTPKRALLSHHNELL